MAENKTINPEIKALQKELLKNFGDNAFVLGSEADEDYAVETVSSGSLNLDLALGTGIPVGRIVEMYGNESVGKTTLAILIMREFQRRFPDKFVGFFDIESALNIALLDSLGIDRDKIYLSKTLTGEQTFDIIESIISSGMFSCLVVDSVSALIPISEQEASMEQGSIGLQARLISKGLKKIVPLADKYGTTVIFLNQLREKVGTFSAYGTPTTTSGGRALKFYSSVRIELKKGEPIKDPNDSKKDIGHMVNAKIVKNKVSTPNRVASFPLIYGFGVDKIEEIADYMILTGLVSKGGAWISMKDRDGNLVKRKLNDETIELKWQGKSAFVEYLRQDEGLTTLILNSIECEQALTIDDVISWINGVEAND